MGSQPISVAIISDRPTVIDAAAAILQSCGISDIIECNSWGEIPDLRRRKHLHAIFADNGLPTPVPPASPIVDDDVLWFAAPTAFDEYNGDDSVLLTTEPIDRWRERLEALLSERPSPDVTAELSDRRRPSDANVPVKLHGGGVKIVSAGDVVFARALKHGSDVHLEDGTAIACYQSLPELERSLGKKRRSFVHCTRILVNLRLVSGVTLTRAASALHFTNGASVAISREDARLVSALVTKHWRSIRQNNFSSN